MSKLVSGTDERSAAAPRRRWWELRPAHLVHVLLWGVLFLALSYVPLGVTDLWGHVAYGQWILEHRELPTEDPWMPLAEGVPIVHSQWLSQVTLAAVESAGGAEALSLFFTLTMLAAYALLAAAFFLRGRIGALATAGVGLVIFIALGRFATIRPENLAFLSLAALLLLIQSARLEEGGRRLPWLVWLGVPLLMALWANLHGSFLIGLLVLGAVFAGRALDVAFRRRSLLGPLDDPPTRRSLWLLELGLAGSLLNPHGLDLLLYSLRFGGNPNLEDIVEWWGVTAGGGFFAGFALSIVLVMVLLRVSPRPVRAAEVLLVLGLGAATVSSERMITWYAPVFVFVAVPHLAAVLERRRALASERESAASASAGRVQPSRLYTWVGALLVWIVFAFSPLGAGLLGGEPRRADQVVSSMTPLELVDYLRADPPSGLVFNPQWWGDWLVAKGPPGLQPMVTTSIHLVPPRVWRDYIRVQRTRDAWREVFPRYGIRTAILDKERMPRQVRQMWGSGDWRLVYEDRQAAVFRRVGLDAFGGALEGGAGGEVSDES